MRRRPNAITALLALACASAAACGGGGGSDNVTVTVTSPFPQGYLPVLLGGASGRGDVAFRSVSDLYAVSGSSDVTVVARENGAVTTFANDVGGLSTDLLSITAGPSDAQALFVGDDDGRIFAISSTGAATLFVDTGSEPITGLALVPSGFGDFGGSLVAAAGNAGVLRITVSDTPAVSTLVDPADRYVDLAFSGTTLFALNTTQARIDTVSATGTIASFQTGFTDPVGIAVDSVNSEIYVADAGDDILKTVPVAGGTPTRRARYDFDATEPSGLAFDGIGAIAFVTSGPFAIRGSNLPRINPASTNFGLIVSGPTVGYGDLELDRLGAFVLAASDDVDPENNFLFAVPRDAGSVSTLESGVGSPVVDLLGVAVDPRSQTTYFSTRSGNIFQRDVNGNESLLVSVTTNVPLLGLELAPATFGVFGGDLIATTEDGRVFAIDPLSPTPPVAITLSQAVSNLCDLVFSADGVLYLVDNDETTSRIFRVTAPGSASWTLTNLGAPTSQLGLADGIEIDEGGDRLFVASQVTGDDQLLAVALGPNPPAGTVTALGGAPNVVLDDGAFPTGVVYDRLGTVVLRKNNNSTALTAVSVAP